MRIAVVGCGFVADLYMMTMPAHPQLQVVGAYDRDAVRLEHFKRHHDVPVYASLERLLNDDRVEIVVNLTTPVSHYEVSRAALKAGKHVYSEKPLATKLEEAEDLVELSERSGLVLAGAPCTLLGETAQTMWKALRASLPGAVRLAYAEMDEGMVSIAPYQEWLSPSGTVWPFKDEFETGCTLEHAGYCLTWLAAFFGPATRVTSFASTLIDDKRTPTPLDRDAPDFSVACLEFESGVVARMTNSIVAPRDHAFRIVGDRGVLHTDESWSIRSRVYFRRWLRIRRKLMLSPLRSKVPLVQSGLVLPKSGGSQRIDFASGVAELTESIQESRPCRLSARFALHVTELALAISNSDGCRQPYEVKSRFDPIEPMSWAR
jgi:predicted dehydrogenase